MYIRFAHVLFISIFSFVAICPMAIGHEPLTKQITGDFNGDGTVDHAQLIRVATTNEYKLVSKLSDGSKHEMLTFSSNKKIDDFTIELLPVGVYKSACNKGYGEDCKPTELRELDLKNEGISFMVKESSSRVYYFENEMFKYMQTSD